MVQKSHSGLVYYANPQSSDPARRYKVGFSVTVVGLVLHIFVFQFYLLITGLPLILIPEFALFPDPELQVYLTLISLLLSPLLLSFSPVDGVFRFEVLLITVIPWFISGVACGSLFGPKSEGGVMVGSLIPGVFGFVGLGLFFGSIFLLVLMYGGIVVLASGVVVLGIVFGFFFVVIVLFSLFFLYLPIAVGYAVGERLNTKIYPLVIHAQPSVPRKQRYGPPRTMMYSRPNQQRQDRW